ncbi:MAG: hypothetical protein ABIO49_07785 [Dokdonella sp.]
MALLEMSAAAECMRFAKALVSRWVDPAGLNHECMSNVAKLALARMTAAVTPMTASVEAATFSLTIRRDSRLPAADDCPPGATIRDILCAMTIGAVAARSAICFAARPSFVVERVDMTDTLRIADAYGPAFAMNVVERGIAVCEREYRGAAGLSPSSGGL